MNIKRLKDSAEDERDMVMFGLFNDGGNIYSSRSDENWYWSVSDGETATEFRKRLKRQGMNKASRNYYEYFGEGASYGVKVFKDIRKFIAAAEKVGLHPNIDKYKYLLEQPKPTTESAPKSEIVFDENILDDKRAKLIWDATEPLGSWGELYDVLNNYKKSWNHVNKIEDILWSQYNGKVQGDMLTLQAIMYVIDNLDNDFGVAVDNWERRSGNNAPDWVWDVAELSNVENRRYKIDTPLNRL